MILTLITFVIVLGLLVFVHELGHFIAAKKAGVGVEEFGFGFPPRIFGIKRGDTIYSLNWIPLGGFVKIKGESGEFKKDKDSFANKKIWQRAIILSSGVGMNAALTIILLAIGFMVGLPQAIDAENLKTTKADIRDPKIQIIKVFDNTPAQKAGLKMGDVLLSIDGKEFSEPEQIQSYTNEKIDKPVAIQFKRGPEEFSKKITPTIIEEFNKAGIGVGLIQTGTVSYPWYLAIYKGFEATIFLTKEIILAFYNLFKDLITAQEVGVEISGPVGIAVLTGQMARMGLIYILQFTALLSLNLAIINFLPFPALDGGRMLFLTIEKIRRRPISQKIEALTHNIGFALLMIIIILVTYHDITKYGGKILGVIKKTIGI